jgi:ABC-type sugar transport system ATPase subunit
VSRIHLIAADRSLSWELPAGAGPAPWPESGQLELGMRPEAIGVHGDDVSHSSASWPTFDAQVRRLEFNGPEVLATLSLGPHRLVARLPAGLPIRDRQHLRIILDLSRAVWFDPESGRVLGHAAAREAVPQVDPPHDHCAADR